jgi:hypothetical protein
LSSFLRKIGTIKLNLYFFGRLMLGRLISSRASIFGCLLLSVRLSLASKSSWIASTREFQVRLTASYQVLLERKGLHAINRNNDNNDNDMMMVLQRMASDMKKRMLDLNRWPIRSSKGTQLQLAMTYVDTNLGMGWYNSWSRDGAMEGK